MDQSNIITTINTLKDIIKELNDDETAKDKPEIKEIINLSKKLTIHFTFATISTNESEIDTKNPIMDQNNLKLINSLNKKYYKRCYICMLKYETAHTFYDQ